MRLIPAPLPEAARRFPGSLALIEGDRAITYAGLLDAATRHAGALRAAGAGPGDRVAFWGPNSLDWAVAMHGASSLGATILPLSARWTDAEAGWAIDRFKPRLVVASGPHASRAEALGLPVLSMAARGAPIAPASAHPADAPLALVLTSGTTGRPKAAALTWGAFEASAAAVGAAIGLGPEDRWWLPMPFHHVGGLGALWRTARHGAAAVIAPAFDPMRALADFAAHGVTLASVVPTMLQAIEEARGDAPYPPAVRALMLGGAAAPPSLVTACPLALPSYGLTEAASTVTLVPPGSDAATRLTSGYPIPGVEVVVREADGRALPAGEAGLVSVRSPALMAGYLDDAAASARALEDGWLHTGDHGFLDAQGRLTVLARREDLIVSGGENLYPAEIEGALLAHPAVAAAAVVPVPDPRWGQVPGAWIVARRPVEAEALDAWMLSRLARYKRPRRYGFLPALPLLSNGKIDRRSLIRLAEEGRFELN